MENKRRYYLHRQLKKYPVICHAAQRLIEVTPVQYEHLVENETKCKEYLDEMRNKGGYSVQLIIPNHDDHLTGKTV